jgi:hypothetical protein
MHVCSCWESVPLRGSALVFHQSSPCTALSNFLAGRLNDYKRLLSPPLETADVSCVTLSGVCPHRLLSAIKSFALTLGGLQVDALLQMLLRLCQATGVVPVKSARSTTDRR